MLIFNDSCSCNENFFGNGSICEEGSCTESFCSDNEQCVSPRLSECECKNGFERNLAGLCVDFDECSTKQAKCHENAECIDTNGSYECSCKEGYFGDGKICVEGQCVEGFCRQNKTCITPTSSVCKCKKGFVPFNGSSDCFDFDECADYDTECDLKSDCVNSIGSYNCICKNGYYQNGKKCDPASVLVLFNARLSQSILISSNGVKEGFRENILCLHIDYKIQDQVACSVMWENSVYIFGTNQISRLTGYELTYLKDLDFSNFNGACSVMNKEFIFLCFDMVEKPQKCRRATHPLGVFITVALPNMSHLDIRTSASNSK